MAIHLKIARCFALKDCKIQVGRVTFIMYRCKKFSLSVTRAYFPGKMTSVIIFSYVSSSEDSENVIQKILNSLKRIVDLPYIEWRYFFHPIFALMLYLNVQTVAV